MLLQKLKNYFYYILESPRIVCHNIYHYSKSRISLWQEFLGWRNFTSGFYFIEMKKIAYYDAMLSQSPPSYNQECTSSVYLEGILFSYTDLVAQLSLMKNNLAVEPFNYYKQDQKTLLIQYESKITLYKNQYIEPLTKMLSWCKAQELKQQQEIEDLKNFLKESEESKETRDTSYQTIVQQELDKYEYQLKVNNDKVLKLETKIVTMQAEYTKAVTEVTSARDQLQIRVHELTKVNSQLETSIQEVNILNTNLSQKLTAQETVILKQQGSSEQKDNEFSNLKTSSSLMESNNSKLQAKIKDMESTIKDNEDYIKQLSTTNRKLIKELHEKDALLQDNTQAADTKILLVQQTLKEKTHEVVQINAHNQQLLIQVQEFENTVLKNQNIISSLRQDNAFLHTLTTAALSKEKTDNILAIEKNLKKASDVVNHFQKQGINKMKLLITYNKDIADIQYELFQTRMRVKDNENLVLMYSQERDALRVRTEHVIAAAQNWAKATDNSTLEEVKNAIRREKMTEIHGDLRNFEFKIGEATDAAILYNTAIQILTNTLQSKQDSLQEQETELLDNIQLFEKSVASVKQSFHDINSLEMPAVTTEVINALFNNKATVKKYLNESQNTEDAQHRLKTMVLKETEVISNYYNVNNRPKPNPNLSHKLKKSVLEKNVLEKSDNVLTVNKIVPISVGLKNNQHTIRPHNDQSPRTISVTPRNLTTQIGSSSGVPISPHSENTIELD